MKRTLALLVCALLAASTFSACSEPARRPVKANPANTPKAPAATAPDWTQGEFPAERAFFGTAYAPVSGSEADARTAATKKATENLTAEIALLVVALKTDHEEQVAEIVTRYSPEEFNGHVDGSVATALEKVKVTTTFTDKSRTPPRLHVLVRLELDDVFAEIYARDGLPDEQKNRIKDYEHVFRDGVMANLSR